MCVQWDEPCAKRQILSDLRCLEVGSPWSYQGLVGEGWVGKGRRWPSGTSYSQTGEAAAENSQVARPGLLRAGFHTIMEPGSQLSVNVAGLQDASLLGCSLEPVYPLQCLCPASSQREKQGIDEPQTSPCPSVLCSLGAGEVGRDGFTRVERS